MDLPLLDPDDVPLPKDDVRLRTLQVTPSSDGRRVRVEVEITPFQERPNLELTLVDPQGQALSRTTVVEADRPLLSLTMHLRAEPRSGPYRVRGTLSYPDRQAQDEREASFVLDTGSPPENSG